jgi:hypothetical protein
VAASVTFGFRSPVGVFNSESMLCNKERIPFPRASLFCLGDVISELYIGLSFDFEIEKLGNWEIEVLDF